MYVNYPGANNDAMTNKAHFQDAWDNLNSMVFAILYCGCYKQEKFILSVLGRYVLMIDTIFSEIYFLATGVFHFISDNV